MLSATFASAAAPVPPSTAKVFYNVETRSGWGHCSDCAANPADSSPPIASWVFQQWQNTPSINGNSTKMGIHGSQAYANVLHWVKLGNKNKYRHFIWEFWVNGDNASLNAQNLEFDLWQSYGGRKYMFGTQCNYKKGLWQIWNYSRHWFDTSIPCHKFKPGTWTRVVWYMERTLDKRMRYVSLTVGNTTYSLNSYQPTPTTSWGNSLGVQFQQDMDKYATDYTIWVDKVKLSIW